MDKNQTGMHFSYANTHSMERLKIKLQLTRHDPCSLSRAAIARADAAGRDAHRVAVHVRLRRHRRRALQEGDIW